MPTPSLPAAPAAGPHRAIRGDDRGTPVYLGSDVYGNKSKRKFLVAHEIGHNLQYRLFGLPSWDYSLVTSYTLCTCEHVPDPGLRSHCLQSKEYSRSAQTEGCGHFYAALAFNNASQSNATFNYYKHFLEPGASDPIPPPNAWDVDGGDAPHKWKDNHCPSSGSHSTEIDWMTFYFEIVSKGSNRYSFTDLKSLYTEVCNGKCDDGDTFQWSHTATAAEAVFGTGTDKAQYWTDLGAAHAVD